MSWYGKLKEKRLVRFAQKHWGKAGSGVLYVCIEDSTALLLLRSKEVIDPDTWGVPGGALKGTEGMYEEEELGDEFSIEELRNSAMEEVKEELGYIPEGEEITNIVIPSGSYKYTTFVIAVSLEEKKRINEMARLNWESEKMGWFMLDRLPEKSHPGVLELIEKWRV